MYCSYPAKKFINRGFLAGPYCPIYGCGAMLILSLLRSFDHTILLVFLMGVLITSALEYLTSCLMEFFFHTKWWDYSTYPFNLHGRICLKNSLLFGVLVLIVYYILQPMIGDLLLHIPHQLQLLLSSLLSVIFLIDLGNTSIAILRKHHTLQRIEQSMQQLYKDFKLEHTQLLQATIKDALQHLLRSTTVDERLQKHLEQFHTQMKELHQQRHKTHERLHNAFPSMKEQFIKKDAEYIFQILDELKNKIK